MDSIDWARVAATALQVLPVLLGALIVVWQVGRQHRSGLELQRENLKDEQRLRLFDDLSMKLAEAESAVVALGLSGLLVPNALKAFIQQSALLGFEPAPVDHRSADLLTRRGRADKAVLEVVRALEYREILNPNFVAFRYAVSAQIERVWSAFSSFHLAAAPLLPLDPPPTPAATGARPRTALPLTDQNVADLAQKGGVLQSECLTLSCFLSDLGREAQNALLGSLFELRLPPRRPRDPEVLVLETSRNGLLRLEQHFDLASHLHADALPSRRLYPQRTALGTLVQGLLTRGRDSGT